MILPPDFITKYQQLLGMEAPAFFEAIQDGESENGFRLNPLKHNFKDVQYSLAEPVLYTDFGYYGSISGLSIDHQAGYLYSQDPSAMFVGEVVSPSPGDMVLDLCAAPGGKSTHLASFMQGSGVLISNEIFQKRAKILSENIERFGIRNAIVTNESPERLANAWPEFFDKVLVDAPCSGEGMFRKDPDAIQYWHRDYPTECATRQKTILQNAYELLKPGGELTYSTCTFSPEEDEQIIAWLLATFKDLSVLPITKSFGISDGHPEWANNNPELLKTARLFPHLIRGEGHFIAKLKKAKQPEIKQTEKKQKKSKVRSIPYKNSFLADFLANFDAGIDSVNIQLFGSQIYALPDNSPDISKLKYQRPGLHLGTLKKNRFEPSFALSLAIDADSYPDVLDVTNEEYLSYRHGEVITRREALAHLPDKGWVLLTNQGKAFCFGKKVGNTIKNFYPKGLRV